MKEIGNENYRKSLPDMTPQVFQFILPDRLNKVVSGTLQEALQNHINWILCWHNCMIIWTKQKELELNSLKWETKSNRSTKLIPFRRLTYNRNIFAAVMFHDQCKKCITRYWRQVQLSQYEVNATMSTLKDFPCLQSIRDSSNCSGIMRLVLIWFNIQPWR